MFLLSRKTLAQPGSEAGAVEEFEILGVTGNVVSLSSTKYVDVPAKRRRVGYELEPERLPGSPHPHSPIKWLSCIYGFLSWLL